MIKIKALFLYISPLVGALGGRWERRQPVCMSAGSANKLQSGDKFDFTSLTSTSGNRQYRWAVYAGQTACVPKNAILMTNGDQEPLTRKIYI